ncbi:MAG: hypothetical protein ACPGU0_05200, partial [Marinirhabdus sp.]
VLFLLPITVYLFFASGVNNFAKLPVLTQGVAELPPAHNVQFKNKISVLCFFGTDVENKKANLFNLAHKIYKKNYQFNDFQFVVLVTPGQEETIEQLKRKLSEIEDPGNYKFISISKNETRAIFSSLQTGAALDDELATDTVFIIDKEQNLRGRNDDGAGTRYGYNAADYAEVNNDMSDDIKVILAEYRLALKKYRANRDI